MDIGNRLILILRISSNSPFSLSLTLSLSFDARGHLGWAPANTYIHTIAHQRFSPARLPPAGPKGGPSVKIGLFKMFVSKNAGGLALRVWYGRIDQKYWTQLVKKNQWSRWPEIREHNGRAYALPPAQWHLDDWCWKQIGLYGMDHCDVETRIPSSWPIGDINVCRTLHSIYWHPRLHLKSAFGEGLPQAMKKGSCVEPMGWKVNSTTDDCRARLSAAVEQLSL